jgi:hypothetical protein
MNSRFERHLDEMERPLRWLPASDRSEMREEAAQHLSDLAAAHEARGATPEQAGEAALAEFGDAHRIGRGVRRQILRRRARTLTEAVLTRMIGGLLGALLALGAAIGLGAPLMAGHEDIAFLYLALGAVLGMAAVARRKVLAWGVAGAIAACLLVPTALYVHEDINAVFRTLLGPQRAEDGVWMRDLRYVFASGYSWGLEDRPLSVLLPALSLGWHIWSRSGRDMSPARAIRLAALAYAVVLPLLVTGALTGRAFISAPALWQYFYLSVLLWAKQGAIFGILLVLTRSAARWVVSLLRAIHMAQATEPKKPATS